MNYSAMAKTAKRLIGSNGTKCILKNPSDAPPIYNVITNEYEKQETSFDGLCIIASFEDNAIDGTIIQAGDRKIVAVLAGEPVPKLSTLDVFDRRGNLSDSFKVINSTVISPDASVVIAYKLQCRK